MIEDGIVFGLNYIGWVIIAMIAMIVVMVPILPIKNRIEEGNWSGYMRMSKKR